MRTLLLWLAACGGSASMPDDATIAPDTVDAGANCFGAGLVTTCLDPLPTAPRVLSTAFSTDSADCVVDKGWCVIAATELSVSALRVTGSRPLVLVATGSITVDNMLDAASRRTGASVELGPGASSPTCIPGQTAAQGGGGPGGTFGGRGGNGGAGTLNSAESGLVVSVTAFRGGCAGTAGDGAPTSGGASGGAVYLIARSQIRVAGAINASGAGGGAGGGGGGSGGMIGLEAPMVSITGSVFANGGGGGEGATGSPGANPTSATTAAPGGSGGAGGDGGTGSAGTTKTGAPGASAVTGGGGGGGGAGVILVIPTQTTGGTLSPAPT